jgi:hypothetical protein
MLAEPAGTLSRDYRVMIEKEKLALRGTFHLVKGLRHRWRNSIALLSRPFSGGSNATVKVAGPTPWLGGTTPLRWTTPRWSNSTCSFSKHPMPRWRSCAKRCMSAAAWWRFTTRLSAWGLGIKKTLWASEQERADVKVGREAWIAKQSGLNWRRIVFVDESGAKTNMTRLRGRARQGARVLDRAPHGH